MENGLAQKVESLFLKQLQEWDLPKQNYAQLDGIQNRYIKLDGITAHLQFNEGRIRSAAAKTDQKSLQERPCFLCRKNRPEKQESVDFNQKYDILINPFPIFKRHLTIAANEHTPQLIENRLDDMLSLAKELPDYFIFYNGAKCGASAPDHMHFQAGSKNMIPLQKDFKQYEAHKKEKIRSEHTVLYELNDTSIRCLIIESSDRESLNHLFYKIYRGATLLKPEEAEPMMNLLCWFDTDHWITVVFLRKAHRPHQFYEEGEANILISPATVEMSGLFVLALGKDYHKLQKEDLVDILDQTLITSDELNTVIRQL